MGGEGGGGGGKQGQVDLVPSVAGDGGGDATSLADSASIREARRRSLRSTAGAYSVVGPEPGPDETSPVGTVTRNAAFQRTSQTSDDVGGSSSSSAAAAALAGAPESEADHSIPEDSAAAPGTGGGIDAAASLPSPHPPGIEYLAEARLVEEDSVAASGEASRPRSQQHSGADSAVMSTGTGAGDDPPPPITDGIAGGVISEITPAALLEAPVVPASSGGRNHRDDAPQASSLGTPKEEVYIAEPLKDAYILSRSRFLIGAGLTALVLGLGLGLGLTRSSSAAPESGYDGSSMVADLLNINDEAVLTYSSDPICFSLLPLMSNVSVTCPDPAMLLKGGPLNQLVVDGILEAARYFDESLDISIINAGSLRSDLDVGDVTAGTIREDILPFGQDRAIVFSTTPAGIKATLEGAVRRDKQWLALSEEESIEQQKQFFPNVRPLIVKWPFEATYPYCSGLRYDVDLTAPNGQRVTNIEIKAKATSAPAEGDNLRGSSTREWKTLDVNDDSTPIRIVASEFLERGGDGYFPGFSSHTETVVLDVSNTDLFILYASQQETLVAPLMEDMSTREFVPDSGRV